VTIVVCIKQVPAASEVPMDKKNGVLQRAGLEAKMNPYDLFAIEEALLIKERYGGDVVALTMGPGQAEDVLRECFYMGVDRAVLLNDKRFAGADVLSTAYTLSQGILTLGDFDLIICGKQTTDGDTAQVGPELAEFLNIPHASNVIDIREIAVKSGPRFIIIEEEREWTLQTSRLPLPCLLSVAKEINEPRLPSYKRMKTDRNKEITVLSLSDMPDTDPKHYGIDGSPTQVIRIFPPEHNTDHLLYEGPAEQTSDNLYKILSSEKFILNRV
jgi:electron transfer flavoprotein beta subunit